jgi:hypothetical protein
MFLVFFFCLLLSIIYFEISFLFSELQEGGMEFLVDGLNLTKTAKKKLDKLDKINIHLHGKMHDD